MGVVVDYLRGRLPFLFRRPQSTTSSSCIIISTVSTVVVKGWCWLWLFGGEKGEEEPPLKFKNSTHGQAGAHTNTNVGTRGLIYLSTFSFSFFPLFFNPRLKWCSAEVKDRFGDEYISLSITGNESQSGTSITININYSPTSTTVKLYIASNIQPVIVTINISGKKRPGSITNTTHRISNSQALWNFQLIMTTTTAKAK